MTTFIEMQAAAREDLELISTDVIVTTTQIKRWLNLGKNKALTYKKWPFLEYKGSDLIDATGNYPYSTLMKTKSAWLVRVGGEKYDKIRYEDYLHYLEDEPAGTDKVWAEFDRTIYINGNACTVGDAIEIYGTAGVVDLSADGDTSPFSEAEPSGDEAIVNYAVAKGLKKLGASRGEIADVINEANQILNDIWDRMTEAMPREQTKKTPFFKKVDLLNGTLSEGGSNNAGRF